MPSFRSLPLTASNRAARSGRYCRAPERGSDDQASGRIAARIRTATWSGGSEEGRGWREQRRQRWRTGHRAPRHLARRLLPRGTGATALRSRQCAWPWPRTPPQIAVDTSRGWLL